MTIEKFQDEIKTLEKFFTKFCEDKHENQFIKEYELNFKDEKIVLDLQLCNECQKLINYSFAKLQNCPHEIKPRCRKCANPCYEKQEWKDLSRIMRYSAIMLGITTKLKKIFNS